MTKALVPIVIGATLGALIVGVLLRNSEPPTQPNPATAGAIPFSSAETAPASLSSDPVEADAAIDVNQLAAISDAASRRATALALLGNLGWSEASIDEISAALAPIEAVNFKIDAIARLGEQDPASALAAATALADPEQRRLALRRLAQSLAEHDPAGAILNLSAIDSAALENEFMTALLDHWAIVDPDQVLAFLETAGDVRIPLAELALEMLATHDPERLLNTADELPSAVRTAAVMASLESFIERDPIAALSRIEELPPGPDRSRLETNVARVYGEQDPDAAWLWANEGAATADTRALVLAGIQVVDRGLALNLMIGELVSADEATRFESRQRIGSYLYYLGQSGTSEDVALALDRILTVDSALAPNVQQFLGNWSNDDPEAALDWTLRNLDRIEPSRVLVSLGGSVVRIDPQQARQTLFRLPEAYQSSWVTGVARSLAENDLTEARALAFEFARGPLRDVALQEVVSSQAHGGSVDGQMFEQFDNPAVRDQAASLVAMRLACNGNLALAREIASTHISAPDQLARTEGQLERNAQQGPNSIVCMLSR